MHKLVTTDTAFIDARLNYETKEFYLYTPLSENDNNFKNEKYINNIVDFVGRSKGSL